MTSRNKMTIGVLAMTAAIITAAVVAGSAFADSRDKGERGWGGWGMRHHGHHRMMGRHGMRGEMIRDRMKEADADGDGKVTKAELVAAQEARLSKHDTDNDGALSLDEFTPLWVDFNKQRIVRGFQFLDRDGDGKVTDAEMKRVVDRIVARADRNDDGAISKDDFKRRGK